MSLKIDWVIPVSYTHLLYARIFMFVLSFEIILILSSRYLGGLISFVICVVFLVSLIKVHDPRNEKT